MMRAWALAALLFATPALAQQHSQEPTAAAAQPHNEEPPAVDWSFNGPFGTYDRAALQRGFQVYKEVCSNCHSMQLLSYRNLTGIGLSEEQVAAVAGTIRVPALDDSGQPIERAATAADRFKSPFPNELAARAANGGQVPPDQSVIVKARDGQGDYVHALLLGYEDPPEGVKVLPGQYYNKYFPGHLLAMPPPLSEGQVTYADDTKATVDQMALDVTQFLTWASYPELEARKRLGVRAVLFLTLMTGLAYAMKKKVWKDLH